VISEYTPPRVGVPAPAATLAVAKTTEICAVVAALPSKVAFIGQDFRYHAVSEPFAKAIGASVQELIGVSHLALCQGFGRDWGKVFQADPEKVSSTKVEEEMFLKKDGGYARFPWTAVLWKDADGYAVGVLLFLEHEQLKLQGQGGATVESEQEVLFGRMTRKLAHDFNNILTVIRGGLELAKLSDDLVLSKQNEELFDNLLLSTDHGVVITRKLLAAGRNQSLEPDCQDLRELLKGIYSDLQKRVPQGVRVFWVELPDGDGGEKWHCYIDKAQFRNAMNAIADNAIEAMPEGGSIGIELLSVAGSQLQFCVSDTGSGMELETLKMAVEPFFTTKTGKTHTGLGLTIADGFFTRSGGRLTIDSSPGNDCRVIATLPHHSFQWGGANQF
jgi:signal transduction histidine kinase